MLFNSIDFLIFFVGVISTYYLIPHAWRWALLLAASYFFYGYWKMEYLSLVVISTCVDYYCGLRLDSENDERVRKRFLYLSVIVNLGILCLFKYYDFFITEANDLLMGLGMQSSLPTLRLILPMGISFYTFQTMSYTIDVYKRKVAAERHFGIFALYVTFFPQLVAGPIERAGHLLGQFKTEKHFEYDAAVQGITKVLYGLFKKVVVADTLALYVNHVYDTPGKFSGAALFLATFFFAIQIYCDFSGYSDIAIGTARLLGFDLMENFNRPYLSRSITEFWRRWHISLSTWFKDYVYIPLGGNRVSKVRRAINLFLTFLISGLWHGANWTFVIWGAIHGFFVVVEGVILGQKVPEARPRWRAIDFLRWGGTMVLVLCAWVFFRAESFGDAVTVLKGMTHVASFGSYNLMKGGLTSLGFMVCFFVVFLLLLSYLLPYNLRLKRVNWLWVILILVIILFGQDGKQAFIYFQF